MSNSICVALSPALLLILLLSLFAPSANAILCRTGVDLLGGPVADCGRGSQCLNTTSAIGQTVYSCDFGGICETILNLRDGCVRDGKRMVCCCSTLDGCNFGPGTPLPRFGQNQSKSSATKRHQHDLHSAAAILKSQSSALDFVKKMEAGSDF